MKITAFLDPVARFLKGQENPWIAFFAWFLFGNVLMMLLFYDVSKWVAFSYFEKYTPYPHSMHYNFVDTVLTLFLLTTGAGAFICGLRAGTSAGKTVCILTIAGAFFLLIFMGLTSDIPPEVKAEVERTMEEMQHRRQAALIERQGESSTSDPFINNQQRYQDMLLPQVEQQPQAPSPYDSLYPDAHLQQPQMPAPHDPIYSGGHVEQPMVPSPYDPNYPQEYAPQPQAPAPYDPAYPAQ